MRILMLSQWFDPEPTFKGLSFAQELVRRGHDVQVLTGFPNYPEGKLYPGYRIRLWQRETLDGIPVYRVPLYPSHDRSAARRTINYLSFAASALVLGPMLVQKPDIIYVYNLITLAPAAWCLKHLTGAAVVYDIQDLWPESVTASGMVDGRFSTILGLLCNLAYRTADQVVTLSPGIRDELRRRGVPEDRVTVIYNWCNEQDMQSDEYDLALAKRLGLAGKFSVMYAGNLGLAQALDAVIEAAALLRETHPDIQFVFVGDGADSTRLKTITEQRCLTNIEFVPRQPAVAMGRILRLADVLLVHLKDDPLFRITIPSKTQAYLAAGRPILMGVRGDAAELVRRSKGGVTCEPGNAASIAQAVLQLYGLSAVDRAAMGLAGSRYYEQELSMEAGVSRFESCFQAALGCKRRA
ncbi:MAG: glycosyltransferase family 4 protein [Anaerolineales bacterium]